MGTNYSREQNKRFEVVKKELDKAFKERRVYVEYKRVKKDMNNKLRNKYQ